MSKKSRVLIIIMLTLAFAASTAMLAYSAGESNNNASSGNQTLYALVLNEYKIPDYTSAVKVYDPNGKEVALTGDTFDVLIHGDYTIDYGNNKTATLKVYMYSPEATFSLTSAFIESCKAGQIYYFPAAVVTNEYKTFDAYSIKVYKEGELLKTISCSYTKPGSYFFAQSGSYRIDYFLTDDFGSSHKKSFNVTVTDVEAIFFDKLPSTVQYGAVLSLGFPYGYHLGNSYSVDVSVTPPNGIETPLKDPTYKVNILGSYVFKYTSVVAGKTLSETQTVNVINVSQPFYFTQGSGTIEQDVEFPSYVHEYAGSDVKGALIRSFDASATFYYNKVIDLSKLGADENFIEFVPYSDATTSLGLFKINLIDAYDHNNKVSFFYRPNVDNNESKSTAYVKAEVNGFSGALFNTPGTNYGTINKDVGTTLYNTYFMGHLQLTQYGKSSRMFSLQYDYANNAVYTIARDKNYQYVKYLIADLDDMAHVGLEHVFKGFKTGEVILSMELISNAGSGFYIKQIGGEPARQSDLLDDLMIVLKGYEDEYPKGAVGYGYKLPAAEKSSFYDENSGLIVSVKKGESDYTSLVSGGVFTPSEAGVYTVEYSLAYRGGTLKKQIEIEILQSAAAINIPLPVGETAVFGSYYFIPDINVTGGSGALAIEYKVTLGGQPIYMQANGGYLIDGTGTVEVTVSVVDFIDFKENKSYQVAIREGAFATVKGIMPGSLRVEEELKSRLPDFDAFLIDNKQKSDLTDTQITVLYGTVDLVISSLSEYKVPETDYLKIIYQAKNNGAYVDLITYTLPVLAKTVANSEDLFITDGGFEYATLENGLLFKMDAAKDNYKITVPNIVSAEGLYFKFSINNEKYGFGKFDIVMTDVISGERLKLSFSKYNPTAGTIALIINGAGMEYPVSGLKGTYTERCARVTETAVIAAYHGKDYTEFEITIDTVYRVIKNTRTGGEIGYIRNFESGAVFHAFNDRVCKAEINIGEVESSSDIVIGAVANQMFNYMIEDQEYIMNDNMGPQMIIYGNSSIYYASINSEYIAARAKAYDVIQNSSFVVITLSNPSGGIIFRNASAASDRKIQLTQYGVYKLRYLATDALGNTLYKDISIIVVDEIAPQFTLKGAYSESYKLNSTLTVLDYEASDNNGAAEVSIFIRYAAGFKYFEPGDEFKLSEKGYYEIIYRIEDSSYNVVRKIYGFNVS